MTAPQAPSKLRIALVQTAPVLGKLERNLKQHEERLAAAQAEGAHLAVFPELSLTGYFLRDMVPDVALAPQAPELAQLLTAAGDMSVVLGFVEQSPRQLFYNAALLAERQ